MKLNVIANSTYTDDFLKVLFDLGKFQISQHHSTFEDLKKIVQIEREIQIKVIEISKIQIK